MSLWLGVVAIFLCCFSAVLLVTVCCSKPACSDDCLCAGRFRESESETDDTRKAVREKLQIRREMPPEVIEHMARIYDLPHGASPACGMSACSSEDARINMPKYKYFSFDNLIKLVKENSSSDNDTTIGISEYLLPAAKAVAKPNLCPACGTCRPSDT